MSQNKIIVTKIENRLSLIHLMDDKIDQFYLDPHNKNNIYPNGTIVICKVQKIVPGINAAFVSLGGKEQYFMSLPKADSENVLLINRPFDGKLKCDDELLVQVTKQAVKMKQPIVDYKITLSGLYSMLESGQKGLQISAKLKKEVNDEIKEAFTNYLENGVDGKARNIQEVQCKAIIRTKAENACSVQEIVEDYDYLFQSFLHILEIYRFRPCFSVLYKPMAPYLEALQNIRSNSYQEIVTDLPECQSEIREILHKEVRLYADSSYPIEKCYGLETKIAELLAHKVWLKSGAFLVIEQGETLTAIDVNSGKSDKKSDHAYYTNMEAVPEIFRQIRARNINGMILIDFINMKGQGKEQELIQAVRREIEKDSVRTQFIDITGLGLMELTREKKLPSLQELWKK